MRIKIIGFKCHLETEYIFANNEMTLIKGASGAGKSSILQAIFWALYGGMRSIYNNLRITKNLSVCLELPGITINRKKNSDLLIVTIGDKIYEDNVAQGLIDKMFGTKEVWKACSYIEQQSRCSLLSGSGSERLELLNALSFTGENPKDYINKISEKLKEVTSLFTTQQAVFTTEIEIYTKSLKGKSTIYNFNEEELNNLRNEISSLESQEKQCDEEKSLLDQQQGTLNYLHLSLSHLKQDLVAKEKMVNHFFPILRECKQEIIIPPELYISETYPVLEENFLITFEKYSSTKSALMLKINSINNLLAKADQREKELKDAESYLNKMQDKIISIPDISNLVNVPVTQEEIWKIAQIETEREKYEKEAKILGIQYDKNIIQETLHSLSNTLQTYTSLETQVQNYKKLLSLEKNIESLRQILNCSKENITSKIQEIEQLSHEKALQISELKKGLELLSCPNCASSLRYKNGVLTLGDRDPVSPSILFEAEEEYKIILSTVNNFRQLLSLEENVKIYQINLDERKALENHIQNNCSSKIDSLSKSISKLANIKYLSPPSLSSHILTDIYNFQKAYVAHSTKNNIEKINTDELLEQRNLYNKEMIDNENLYKLEQERVKRNQDKIQEYQKKESVRLMKIKKLESEKEELERQERKNKEREQQLEKLKQENFQLVNDIKIKEKEIEKISVEMDLTVKHRYNEIKKKLEEKKKLLNDSIESSKIIEKGKELEEKRNVLLMLQKDVEILTRLKLKAIEVECKQLEDTVDNINTVLETTLPIFFNEPISLKLLLYKKMKKTVKPMLNLEICYKGCKYDNINNLSGGEGDRISLALLLALNTVSNSPLLLLDECVASLDPELKESCLTAIKTIPNKTVICVDHDDSLEGFYDSVLSLS